MNSSGDFGVVVFSMGASFDAAFAHSLLPNLFQAFSRLPQKVLMKIRPSHFANASAPPNVKFTHWFPQQDILGENYFRAICFLVFINFITPTGATFILLSMPPKLL